MADTVDEHPAGRDGGAAEGATEEMATTRQMPAVGRDENALVCPRCGTDAAANTYCSSCGFHLAAQRELPTRAAFRAAADSTPAKPTVAAPQAAITQDGSQARDRNLRVLVPIIALVAVAALGIGVVSLLANRPKSDAPLRAQVRHLQAQLSAADQRLATEQATISSIKANSQAGAVTKLQNQVLSARSQIQAFQVCVPELQQEINGLNVNTSYQSLTLADGSTPTFLTSAYLNNPTVVSTNCGKTLNGH